MGSGRGWLAGDWPSTGGVLNITAAAWIAASTGGVLATKSKRKMLASIHSTRSMSGLHLVVEMLASSPDAVGWASRRASGSGM